MNKTHRCGHPIDPTRPRQCRICRAAGMRIFRALHPLTQEQREKANARAYANVYQRRGHLTPKPCQRCGATPAQKHHPDYSDPLRVEWFCRPCHLIEHRKPICTSA